MAIEQWVVTNSATIGCKLESCFESFLRLKLWALKTLNLQVATKPFHIQEVSKPLKLQCTCVFHFTFYISMCLNDFFFPCCLYVCSLILCMWLFVCNVHCVHTTLCTLWMIVAASIQCKWFQFCFIMFSTSDFKFCFIMTNNPMNSNFVPL